MKTSFILYLFFGYCHDCIVGQKHCWGDGTYRTDLKTKDLQMSCQAGGRIVMLASCHCGHRKKGKNSCKKNNSWDPVNHKRYEDRRWKWECDHNIVFSTVSEETILEEIKIDSKDTTRMCPANKAVKKIWSNDFSDDKKDRNFFVVCDILLSQIILENNCQALPGAGPTSLDKEFVIHISDGYVMTGMWTKHTDSRGDREFQFYQCPYCETPFWEGWGVWSGCAACDSGATQFVEMRSRKCNYDKDKAHLSVKCKFCKGEKTEEQQVRSCICRQSAPTTQNVHELEDLINSGNITLNDTGIDEAEQEVTDQEEDVVTEALDLNVTGQVLGGGQGFNELKKNDGDGPLIDLSSPRVIFCIIIIGVSAMMIIGTLGYVAYYTFGQGGNAALDAQGKKGEGKKKREQEKGGNESSEA